MPYAWRAPGWYGFARTHWLAAPGSACRPAQERARHECGIFGLRGEKSNCWKIGPPESMISNRRS